ASSAGRANAANREPELIGYLSVRYRRIGHEQLHEPLPLPGQPGYGLADILSTLTGQNALVDLRFMSDNVPERAVIVNEHNPLARRQAAQALAPRRDHQPRAHPRGIF